MRKHSNADAKLSRVKLSSKTNTKRRVFSTGFTGIAFGFGVGSFAGIAGLGEKAARHFTSFGAVLQGVAGSK
jgi:hypothetical protein